MTKQEIIDKINATIKGQGLQIDAGGALGDILEGIVGLLPTEIPTKAYLTMLIPPDGFEDLDSEEAAEILQISTADLGRLEKGEYPSIIEKGTYNSYLVNATEGGTIYFFSGDATGFGASFALRVSGDLWTLNEI